MGQQIIKVEKELDLYIVWSSVVESPLYVGSTEEVASYLMQPTKNSMGTHINSRAYVDGVLDRATRYGSSGYEPFGCTWDDAGEIFEQRGFLPRKNLKAFAEIFLETENGNLNDEQWSRLMALLEPFDGETAVRTKR